MPILTTNTLNRTVDVIINHLERFAFRETPEINWHPHDDAAGQARLG